MIIIPNHSHVGSFGFANEVVIAWDVLLIFVFPQCILSNCATSTKIKIEGQEHVCLAERLY